MSPSRRERGIDGRQAPPGEHGMRGGLLVAVAAVLAIGSTTTQPAYAAKEVKHGDEEGIVTPEGDLRLDTIPFTSAEGTLGRIDTVVVITDAKVCGAETKDAVLARRENRVGVRGDPTVLLSILRGTLFGGEFAVQVVVLFAQARQVFLQMMFGFGDLRAGRSQFIGLGLGFFKLFAPLGLGAFTFGLLTFEVRLGSFQLGGRLAEPGLQFVGVFF